MRVLQVPFGFHPDPVGGTEVFVEALAAGLLARGLEVEIAAPTEGASREYRHAGLAVHRFALGPAPAGAGELYGLRCDTAVREFEAVLDRVRPDVVHFHALTRGVNPELAQAARARGVATVFTYHTPTVSCQRGTLLEWGESICDGVLDVRRCAACSLHAAGIPRTASRALARLPQALGAGLGVLGAGGPLLALQMPQLSALRQTALRQMLDRVDRVVAVSTWVRDLLARNGVPAAKLSLSRQGVPYQAAALPARRTARPEGPIRAVLLGRLDPIKGFELPIQALRSAPGLAVQLDVFAVPQAGSGRDYEARVRSVADADPRVRLREPIAAGRVLHTLAEYDVLLVPSQGLETGPLVVYEAFAAGVPVVGSALGGIAELVRDGVDGLLVEPASSAAAWGAALQRLATDRRLLERLRDGVEPPRRMDDVAAEMTTLYQDLRGSRSTTGALASTDLRTGL